MGSHLPLTILFVVPYAPSRIRTRPFHLVRALAAAGHRVTLATLWSDDEDLAAIDALRPDLDRVIAVHLSRTRPAWNCLRALLTVDPMQAHFSWHPQFADALAQAVVERAYDVVHVEHLRGVRYGLWIRDVIARTRYATAVVWDSVDCISELFRRAARESAAPHVRLAARLELGRTERFEGLATTRFPRVTVTSETDRQQLLALAATTPWLVGSGAEAGPALARRVVVVPNGVDLDHYAPDDEPRDQRTIVITGKMSYHANVAAVTRFVRETMPLVWGDVPETRLIIVGKDPPHSVRRLATGSHERLNGVASTAERVTVTGTVTDVRPYLRRAALAVAPIQYGVGIQNKVLEALACGTPVVATPRAVVALRARVDEDLAVADGPDALSRTIVSLLHDHERRVRLGRAGRSFVERHHDWRVIAAQMAQVYRDARHVA